MPNNRRRLVGRVVSDKMQKTVVVLIETRKVHPIYKKVVARSKKVMAHDESDAVPVGALVRIVESKPLSRHKRWVVETVLEQPSGPLYDAAGAVEEVQEILAEVSGEEIAPVNGEEAEE